MAIDTLRMPTLPAAVSGLAPIAAEPEDGPDTVEWLVDNAAAFDRLLAAIDGARESVWIAQLALDADCVAHGPGGPRGIVAALLALAARRPGADIRVLVNATLLLDTSRALGRFLRKSEGGARMTLRGLRRFPSLLHAKVAVVDGRQAFLLGSPFADGYWDEPGHTPLDERRPLRELSGRPVHDLSIGLRGPAAARLASLFDELWDVAGDGERPVGPAPDRPLDPRSTSPRVALTLPPRLLPSRPEGATEVLSETLATIARARRLIYVEHQYLSSRPVVAALAAALEREPGLELILVLNQNPDITAYRSWQNARLAEQGWLSHPRVGVFALWTAAPAAHRHGVTAINQVFVHSKALLVDDDWAGAGSANLDGASLDDYGDDFASRLGRRVFGGIRNVDVNIVVDETAPGARRGDLARLRARLWAEHLGISEAAAGLIDALGPAPVLPTWRDAAARNVASLAAADGGIPRMTGFLLPYSPHAAPADQLAGLGIRVDPARHSLCFRPGRLELACSAGWVRNMVA